MDNRPSLRAWCDRVADGVLPWEHLPTLGLYMDQVLTLMDGQLAVASLDGDNPVTPSMINNYAKDGALPRPQKKKYSREHLAILYMICMMKSQLPLPQIRLLLSELFKAEEAEAIYREFTAHQTAQLQATADEIAAQETDKEALLHLAMRLAAEGNARHLAAMHILRQLEDEDESAKAAEKAAEKAASKAAKAAKKAEKNAEESEGAV